MRHLLARLAGAAAAGGLAAAAVVGAAAPASAAVCSGTSGVTVIVDTGSDVANEDNATARRGFWLDERCCSCRRLIIILEEGASGTAILSV